MIMYYYYYYYYYTLPYGGSIRPILCCCWLNQSFHLGLSSLTTLMCTCLVLSFIVQRPPPGSSTTTNNGQPSSGAHTVQHTQPLIVGPVFLSDFLQGRLSMLSSSDWKSISSRSRASHHASHHASHWPERAPTRRHAPVIDRVSGVALADGPGGAIRRGARQPSASFLLVWP